MNQNELAKAVANREGLKESVNIAQIKEIIKITLEELAKLSASECMKLVERHKQLV